ncbi:YncE family protein [Streptacidiphilus carbonis]|uniref:YncE family protein n=1 Tax=Streptacidiphilus carbonis TaxID=105422 RepID=UPI000AD12E5D|nr:YncE family protein [Streptacidiphilus carbonis]
MRRNRVPLLGGLMLATGAVTATLAGHPGTAARGAAPPARPLATAQRGPGALGAGSQDQGGSPPAGVYAATGSGMLSPAVTGDPQLVYVPNSGETGMHGVHTSPSSDRNTVTVIDPRTFKVVGHLPAGTLPQHVTPSWDLRTLWVDASGSNQLIPVDPRTARPGAPVPVEAPYNLYFTPDGQSALVMAERLNRIDVRDPHTMALRRSVPVPCEGINHADFSADGGYFIASCEFSGQLLKFDSHTLALLGTLDLGQGTVPQDVRLGPDGRTFFIASLNEGGLITVDGATLHRTGTIPTAAGAHGVYPSRDGKLLYVSNRDAGSVTVVDPATRKAVATWPIPGGGSPDMGSVSADGTQLWLSGRDNDEVYVFSTTDGHLLARIPVGANPHGLTFFPQPGRYSLGHTGNYR